MSAAVIRSRRSPGPPGKKEDRFDVGASKRSGSTGLFGAETHTQIIAESAADCKRIFAGKEAKM